MGVRKGSLENLAMNDVRPLTPSFWKARRVLVTGHTGFKGGWLTIWLNRLGARVTGISLPPESSPNLYSLAGVEAICDSHLCDIRDAEAVTELFGRAKPEIVFHLAAQPLVRASYRDPIGTFSTNVMGTVHILDAIRIVGGVQVALMITTDKVYRNNEWAWPYREDDVLGGYDPYSASKSSSELVISSYRDAFLRDAGVRVASARAGNVIGGGDWSEDRLIPDAIRAWQSRKVLEIRNPHSVRPWQHVIEPLYGYMRLVEQLWETPGLSGAYNFGPETGQAATVRQVVEEARAAYGDGDVHYAATGKGPHEAGRLVLEVAKSRDILGVESRWSMPVAVRNTMQWYRAQHEGGDARTLCESQIESYERLQ